jgi:hypothetical protein
MTGVVVRALDVANLRSPRCFGCELLHTRQAVLRPRAMMIFRSKSSMRLPRVRFPRVAPCETCSILRMVVLSHVSPFAVKKPPHTLGCW